MKHKVVAAIGIATLLGGCAHVQAPADVPEDQRCGGANYKPQEHKLKVRKTDKGKPRDILRKWCLGNCDAAIVLVCTGDTVSWSHAGSRQFSIVFKEESGSPTKDKSQLEFRGAERVTIAIVGDGSQNKVYKYDVKNDAGALDPMIVVER